MAAMRRDNRNAYEYALASAEWHPVANRSTPIFAARGIYDDVLPIELGEAALDFAITRGRKVDWSVYSMPHSVCEEEIPALSASLGALLIAPS
jgi:phospholipase/carboxylesterase